MKYLLCKEIGFTTCCVIVMTVACAASTLSGLGTEVDKLRNRFLILDGRIVEKVENVRLSVGAVQKLKANPMFLMEMLRHLRFLYKHCLSCT